MSATTSRRRARVRVRVTGTVQGVGFRPYVHRLAGELALEGWVRNDAAGVEIDVEGAAEMVEAFLRRLPREAPPLAIVESITAGACATARARGFTIRESPRDGSPSAGVPADSATCDACLRELFDPFDRRFRHPFINCTDCGPRFTIVRGIPYDRPFTTMAAFAMCPACRDEYEDPGDRRFHAQPNACPACGPRIRLTDPAGAELPLGAARDPVAAAAALLSAGAILAVKGIGGYHLACRADDEAAVARLRARKHRGGKPFALMVGDVAAAARLAAVGEAERALLASPAGPIVLVSRQPQAAVADGVAPRMPELGIMLAHTPLQHLLVTDLGGAPLVMTSGNLSEEPIAFRDEDALARLAAVADAFLLHDRPIETRTDDSVVTIAADRPLFVRRSRGYVPRSLPLPGGAGGPALLACGAELKSTFCLARGGRAWVSHHIGDLQNLETLASFAGGIDHLQRLLEVEPELIAHDLHPDLLSTRHALALAQDGGLPRLAVQHHHAHLAACLAEHGEPGPAIGAIFDGTGLGPDGTVWGGEILLGSAAGFHRAGHLMNVGLPGGEQAIRQPWRMACAWLGAAGVAATPRTLSDIDPRRWRAVAALATTRPTIATSSVGRLFDAVAALTGVRSTVTYEGQAAIELAGACDPHERGRVELTVAREGGRLVIDPRPAVAEIARLVEAGLPSGVLASRFHAGLAAATVAAVSAVAADAGVEVAVLAGGVFANRRLLEAVSAGLIEAGLRVLWPQRLPPGDGGISFGQAAVAAVAG